MIHVYNQQREISKTLPPPVQHLVRNFRTEGVNTIRKVATLTDQNDVMKAAVVYGVLSTPLLMPDVGRHVRWLYTYEHSSWWVADGGVAHKTRLMRGIHLEETVREANRCVTEAVCPLIRFSIVDDRSITPRAVAWPQHVSHLLALHEHAMDTTKRRSPESQRQEKRVGRGVAPMAGMFHVVPLGAFPAPKLPAALEEPPMPASVATSRTQQIAHIRSLSVPYVSAASERGMSCLCFSMTIRSVMAKEYAQRPIMFSAYVSLSAADSLLRPIPSLYVPFESGSTAWCVVPLAHPTPATAKIHIDAYQEMNNAAGTRVTHCKIAHAHFALSALAVSCREFDEVFVHCVEHAKSMFTARFRHEFPIGCDLFGESASRISLGRVPSSSSRTLPVPLAKIEQATDRYLSHLHDMIEMHGGMSAKFPSGKTATNIVYVSDTTEGPIPIVSYFNMSVGARIVSEKDPRADAFVSNLCHLACVLLMVPVHTARERVAACDENKEFCLRLLAACARVVPMCLAYSVDKEGEVNTLPWSVPDFKRQQVDCEELALLCSMVFHLLRRAGQKCPVGSLARLLADRVCAHYDPMLCLITTSTESSSVSTSGVKVAEEVDATHLVCVLWPSTRGFSPILLETMANVSPLPRATTRKDHEYLPLSLHPLNTQEKFVFDHVYRDVTRVFLFDREAGKYVEQLVLRSNATSQKDGVGAPFSEIMDGPRARLVPVRMSKDIADATDLSNELTYPLGMTLDSSALSMSEERADACTKLLQERKCAHTFLMSTDRRSMALLTGKSDTLKLEESIRQYLLEEIKKAEKSAVKYGGESGSYSIDGVMPGTPFYLLPGLYAHVVGLKFPTSSAGSPPSLYLRSPSSSSSSSSSNNCCHTQPRL